MQIAEALRLLRTRLGVSQTAASQREGAPDFRTLSHWETRRKMPSLKLLGSYLDSQGLDFHDLQDALDQVRGVMPRRLRHALTVVEQRLEMVEGRLRLLEDGKLGAEAPTSETGAPSARQADSR